MAEKHIVKNWRGTRSSYNAIKKAGLLDYWTRYMVKDENGLWSEYYGDNLINLPSGQLLPVKEILETLGDINTYNPGDRFLVGKDADGNTESHYEIVTINVNKEDGSLFADTMKFDEKYSVRVKSKGLKSYILLDGILRTYDDCDAGSF